MASYSAQVQWSRGDQPFTDNAYSRRHTLAFDGGATLLGSSSPHVVPVPRSDPAGADPEELFVASLSSCHMLWFLDLARQAGYCVDSYTDGPVGEMARNPQRKLVMSRVTLRPAVQFSGAVQPSPEELADLHHRAHEECFIANSVRTEVVCEPVLAGAL
jgi:organic hydroperoxide reductase OsmC/OhrA